MRLFLFNSFVTRSNLSSFATGFSLWAESALSVVAFVSVSCLGGLYPLVLGPFHVLVVSPPLSAALGRVECPLRHFTPLGSSPSLSIPWGFVPSSTRLPFLLFFLVVLSQLSEYFCGLFYSCGCCCVVMFLCRCCCLLNLFSFIVISFITVGGKPLASSPRLPSFFGFSSSGHIRPMRLASSPIPSGPLCPWR